MRISNHFNLEDFTRSDTATKRDISNEPNANELENLRFLAQNLDRIVQFFGPGVKISISSGFRSKLLNKAVGGAQTSQHGLGEAADCRFYGIDTLKAFDAIRTNPNIRFDQLIYEKRGKNGAAWLHISFTRRRQPRRSVLVATFNAAGKASYAKPNWQPQPYQPKILPVSSPNSHVDASKGPPAKHQQSDVMNRTALPVAAPALPPVDVPDTHPPSEMLIPLSKKEQKAIYGSPELLALAREKGRVLLKTISATVVAAGTAGLTYLKTIWGYMQTTEFIAVIAVICILGLLAWVYYFTHDVHRWRCDCSGQFPRMVPRPASIEAEEES